jgi:hypothetical protein
MEPALKPCPYCGQQPVVSENPWGSMDVECDNGSCPVTTHVGTFEGDPFKAWNTRPGEERAVEAERARIIETLNEIQTYVHKREQQWRDHFDKGGSDEYTEEQPSLAYYMAVKGALTDCYMIVTGKYGQRSAEITFENGDSSE